MINTFSFPTFTPIQRGKWDKAFAMAGNPNVGFDFANTPFGTDQFDGYFKIKTPSTLKYQDVFTGFIFYKPLEEHIVKEGFPFMLNNFEDTLIRRAECVSASNADSWKEYINLAKRDKINSKTMPYANYYNWITTIGFSILWL